MAIEFATTEDENPGWLGSPPHSVSPLGEGEIVAPIQGVVW